MVGPGSRKPANRLHRRPTSFTRSFKSRESSSMNRRDFQKLAAAAMSGLMAGASLASAAEKKAEKKAAKKKDPAKPLLLQEPHVCRGLNTCKGLGKGGKNTCAGAGECATAKAHDCSTDNDCAGLGGCGQHPGENKCKGMGGCHVPLESGAWAKARKSFEAAMKKAGKQVQPAPKAKSE
jgi:hypothetical protein